MENRFFELLRIKNLFLQKIKEQNIVVYIAPYEQYYFEKFSRLVDDFPDDSIPDILNQNNIVQSILFENFPQNTKLNLYVINRNSAMFIFSTLTEYIEKYRIDFKY